MTADKWKKQIIKNCKSVGTYKPEFKITYDMLSDTLEKLDEAQEQFKASGGEYIVEHTNKGGATNIEQNPALRLISTLKDEAAKLLRECGLTAASLKKINEAAANEKKEVSALAKALAKYG